MSISTIEEGRLEMRRTYSFGERTFFSLAGRSQHRQILTSWKKQIIVSFRIRLFCITFSGPVLSYPVPKKGRGYPVPGACVLRGGVGSGWGNVPTGLSSAGK